MEIFYYTWRVITQTEQLRQIQLVYHNELHVMYIYIQRIWCAKWLHDWYLLSMCLDFFFAASALPLFREDDMVSVTVCRHSFVVHWNNIILQKEVVMLEILTYRWKYTRMFQYGVSVPMLGQCVNSDEINVSTRINCYSITTYKINKHWPSSFSGHKLKWQTSSVPTKIVYYAVCVWKGSEDAWRLAESSRSTSAVRALTPLYCSVE